MRARGPPLRAVRRSTRAQGAPRGSPSTSTAAATVTSTASSRASARPRRRAPSQAQARAREAAAERTAAIPPGDGEAASRHGWGAARRRHAPPARFGPSRRVLQLYLACPLGLPAAVPGSVGAWTVFAGRAGPTAMVRLAPFVENDPSIREVTAMGLRSRLRGRHRARWGGRPCSSDADPQKTPSSST